METDYSVKIKLLTNEFKIDFIVWKHISWQHKNKTNCV